MKILALIVVTLGLWAAPARAQSASSPDDELASVQRYYAGVTAYDAKLRIDSNVPGTLWSLRVDGKLTFTQPGDLRVTPYKKRLPRGPIRIDGAIRTALTFLSPTLANDFTPAFDTSGRYGSKTDVVVELIPTAPASAVRAVHLVVDAATHRVREAVVVETGHTRHHVRFYEPELKR